MNNLILVTKTLLEHSVKEDPGIIINLKQNSAKVVSQQPFYFLGKAFIFRFIPSE